MTKNQWDKYADIFDRGIGDGNEMLHSKFIDPLIFKYLGKKYYSHIVDLGCGNGYLLKKLTIIAEKVTGLDYSGELLKLAKNRVKNNDKVTLIECDLSKLIALDNSSCNVLIANMLLQYIPTLKNFSKEAARVLKENGVLIIIVDHPGHFLFSRAQELSGKKDPHFITSGSYFKEEKRVKKSLWNKATLEYYHRPISDYIKPFLSYFRLEEIDENTQDGEIPRILSLMFKK